MNRRESVAAQSYRSTVLFEPAEEGGYTVTCPSLPGLVTEGDTLEEARAMVADAIRGYLEALAKDGLPIPRKTLSPEAKSLRKLSRSRSTGRDRPAGPAPSPTDPRPGASWLFLHHVRGSHHYLRHPERPGVLVTVPFHDRDLKRGTLRAILRQAGLTPEELRDLL